MNALYDVVSMFKISAPCIYGTGGFKQCIIAIVDEKDSRELEVEEPILSLPSKVAAINLSCEPWLNSDNFILTPVKQNQYHPK